MAHTSPKYQHVIFTLFIFSSLLQTQSYQFSSKLSPNLINLKKEKLTHLHFYFHSIPGGDNPSAVQVAQANMTKSNPTFFGTTVVTDAPLTVGPNLTSEIVGRGQGIYAFDSLSEDRLLVALNYLFVEGTYNGSTLSILGANPFTLKVREMPIVGGSGLFRFARGYALVEPYSFDNSTGYAVFEYNVYVLHY